jgi:hypothetical protein
VSGTGVNWLAAPDTLTGTNVTVDEGLDALRTICGHAHDLADALDLAAMCGLTQAQEDE